MRVLDFGSGQGDLFVKLRPVLPAAELAGFELSESGVAISRRKVPNGKVRRGRSLQAASGVRSVPGLGDAGHLLRGA